MNFAKRFIIIIALLALATPLHAGQTTPDSPQSLYLQAGKEERSGSAAKAREIYESIVDRFPESEFAVKANDRLLALPSIKQKSESAPPASPSSIFITKPPKPLPAEPLLRRGVEAARMKARAEDLRREELERERERYSVREGHRINRSVLAEKESQWQKAADRKVLAEFGMTLDEMGEKLRQLCVEATVTGECSEEAFYLLSATP
jgi:hypothetical protein